MAYVVIESEPLISEADHIPQFEFLRQLSSDSADTVVGLVRNKEATEKKIAAELGQLKNVHVIQADLLNYNSLKARDILLLLYHEVPLT